MLDLMERADLGNEIQADLYRQWSRAQSVAEREDVYHQVKLVERVMNMIRRMASDRAG